MKNPTPNQVIRAACEYYAVPVPMFHNHRLKSPTGLLDARRSYIHICREVLGMTYAEIAEAGGWKTQNTVTAQHVVARLRAVDLPAFKAGLIKIELNARVAAKGKR